MVGNELQELPVHELKITRVSIGNLLYNHLVKGASFLKKTSMSYIPQGKEQRKPEKCVSSRPPPPQLTCFLTATASLRASSRIRVHSSDLGETQAGCQRLA